MKRAVCLLVASWALVAAAPSAYRSKGYAGSLPVGQFAALAQLDCAKINKAPGLPHLLVPLSDECDAVIPAPNARLAAEVHHGRLFIVDGGSHASARLIGILQPMMFMWNPGSDGFFINDGQESGQTSRFRYFGWRDGRWVESRRFDRSAERLYKRRYDCRAGRHSYANVSGMGWKGRLVRAIVQEGVHSEGCIQPYQHRNVMLEVIGDPSSGRIVSSREVQTVD